MVEKATIHKVIINFPKDAKKLFNFKSFLIAHRFLFEIYREEKYN